MKDVAVVCAMSINSKMDEEAIRLEDGIERLLNDELNLKKVLTAYLKPKLINYIPHNFWQLFVRYKILAKRLCIQLQLALMAERRLFLFVPSFFY